MAAYAALASLAQTTVDTNHAKFHFFTGAKEKIGSILEYAVFLLTFLEDYPERASRWEGKLRDLAHEAEDIIEQFLWRLSFYERAKISSLKFEEELSNVTEKFCLLAGDVMEERPAYSSLSLSSSSSSAARIAATGDGVAIGLNEDVMGIKDRLCGLSSKLEVVPILGMGGIGKTTLARTVYDDPLIMHHFDIRVWLTISQDYSEQKVLLGLVDSMKLIEKDMSALEMNDTPISTWKEKVYKNLMGRRYLAVMDDVWSTKVWDDVRSVFPDDANGSRIMLTTRVADPAVYPDSSSAPHEMSFMNDSQSWDLLKGKVFEDRNCPPELEDVGKRIARSCGGLPLAVVLVAGFLSGVDKNPSSWEEISKNVLNPIVGKELEEILSLSYKHLSHRLRPCFLFMAMFPEDENIRASRLIRLWLAEGFLMHQNGKLGRGGGGVFGGSSQEKSCYCD
ncbi:putative late blight resistance protein homolog R1B-16 [Salvia hispanica]|uniref:putative late blight resistance protein homolog R1B-16 n=1 Tax=Salvia hispanica TaxID=49212 RepID=UPI002009CFD2|nr:putative late blight resistance protein homolog R1B-16 [Salvia hispanica]